MSGTTPWTDLTSLAVFSQVKVNENVIVFYILARMLLAPCCCGENSSHSGLDDRASLPQTTESGTEDMGTCRGCNVLQMGLHMPKVTTVLPLVRCEQPCRQSCCASRKEVAMGQGHSHTKKVCPAFWSPIVMLGNRH